MKKLILACCAGIIFCTNAFAEDPVGVPCELGASCDVPAKYSDFLFIKVSNEFGTRYTCTLYRGTAAPVSVVLHGSKGFEFNELILTNSQSASLVGEFQASERQQINIHRIAGAGKAVIGCMPG